jgi:UDP-4-keto-D-QuiNAc 4-reductase
MKALVTGATGQVGRALLRNLAIDSDWQLRAAVRVFPASPVKGCEYVGLGDLGTGAGVTGIATGCDVVIHAAARVHVMRETQAAALTAYQETNVAGTLRVAQEAARCGVRRFIFISSVKVNGESSPAGRPFREDDPADPQNPYAISKHEAELDLRQLCGEMGMEFVVIRPPLVYGPEAVANFLALATAIKRGVPLPLGAIRNRRSLVAIDNLVHFTRLCMEHPAAANETFLVSDGHDLSTPELVSAMAAALNRPARLLRVPGSMLRLGGVLAGRRLAAQRLLENLQVDIGKAREVLAWNPPVTIEEGLRRAMQPLREA